MSHDLTSRQNRLRAIRQRRPICQEVLNFIEENKEKFKGKVYGPLAMHVGFTSPFSFPKVFAQDALSARYLEHVLGDGWLSSFVFEREEDNHFIASRFKTGGLRFLYTPNWDTIDFKRPVPLEQVHIASWS